MTCAVGLEKIFERVIILNRMPLTIDREKVISLVEILLGNSRICRGNYAAKLKIQESGLMLRKPT